MGKNKYLFLIKNQPFLALFFVFLISTFTNSAQAFEETLWDVKAGLVGRTYPVGAQIVGTGGWNAKLWGDSRTWKYGYLRGALNVATSAVVHRAGAELQFFPISILGFSAGYDWGLRNFTPKWLDCSAFECNGRVDRKYVKINAVGAYSGVILSFLARYENLRAPDATKPLFDEVTLLVGKASGENVLTLNPALLYTLSDIWKVGATSIYSRAIDTGGFTHLYGPIANWGKDEWSVIAGVGLNRSPVVHSAITGFFMLSYTFEPSLAVSEMALRFRN